MATLITGPDAKALRLRNGWTLQMVANMSGINKGYLSEFENGIRPLSEEMQTTLAGLLEAGAPQGKARPRLVTEQGHVRLVFAGPDGTETYRPRAAFVEWTEDDGTSYRMFVGER